MLDKKSFNKIRKEHSFFEAERENIIRLSRDILRLSKLAISSVHRNDFKGGRKALSEAEKIKKSIKTKYGRKNNLLNVPMLSSANQEYVEAACYLEFCQNNRLPAAIELAVDYEDYLLGLCDLTGELMRRAVNQAINSNYEAVKKIAIIVEEIYSFFLSLDLRNCELRKKSDSIKWNMVKINDILYDIKMKGK